MAMSEPARRIDLPDLGLLVALSLGLVGYVYAIGWAITCVRLAAVGLPIGFSLPSIDPGAVFATGARSVLIMAIALAGMCAFAYLIHVGNWDRHASAWRSIVVTDRTSARRRRDGLKVGLPRRGQRLRRGGAREAVVRIVAGFNVGVLAATLGLIVGRLARTLIDQWEPGHWWALLAPWALCTIVIARLLTLVSPLRGGRLAHTLLWTGVVTVAMISSAPVGLLVLTWIGIGTLGRQFGGRSLPSSPSAFLRSPLPWALLTVYLLVALSYAATPPVRFPQTIVQSKGDSVLGGYIGRTGLDVYLATCTPLADATSTNDRIQAVPVGPTTLVTSNGIDYILDTGYRPSLPTLGLHALGIDTETVAWIRPEVRERQAPCVGTPPPRPNTGSEARRFADNVFEAGPTTGTPHDIETPLEHETHRIPRIAALAKRYQPTLLTSITDPFWPVSLTAVLRDIGSDGRHTCVRHGSGSKRCAPGEHATIAQLQENEGAAEDFLEYPVSPALTYGPQPQLEALLRGIHGRERNLPSPRALLADPGTLDPWASAQIYFYLAGAASRLHWPVAPPYRKSEAPQLIALEYWFFYPYNYFPTLVQGNLMQAGPIAADLLNTDLHQGDWEHVVVLVQRSNGTARWLYTARHANEGQFIAWSDPSLPREGEHPIVQAAYGGHPTYPAGCGQRSRYISPLNGRVGDWLVCGSGRFAFNAATTPLVDLAARRWACWRGHFGAPSPNSTQRAAQSTNIALHWAGNELKKYFLVAGPRSPLWQAENGHLQADDGETEHQPDSGPCTIAEGPADIELKAERAGLR
jgi:hypothetical protein